MGKIKDFLINETELIANEFPKIDFEELSLLVWDLINSHKNYTKLNKNDRYDYLVDSILAM